MSASIPKDREEQIKFFKERADKGDLQSMYQYGELISNGKKPNKAESVRYVKMAADGGLPIAQNTYAMLLKRGLRGVPKNIREAANYYKMAADGGLRNAMNTYGEMLKGGIGVPVNKEEALRYFKMGMEKGDSIAAANYRQMLNEEKGITPKKEEKPESKFDYCRNYLMSFIPDGTPNKFHVQKRDAIIEYLKKHPEITFSTVYQWANDIKTGRFTLKQLED